MNTCCICVNSITAREFYVEIFDGCSCAPLICQRCRQLPEALKLARDLLKEHLNEKDAAGKLIHTPVYVESLDPWANMEQLNG